MDFEYWIDGVVGTCELIVGDTFWKVWVDHEYTTTSIHYYDELYEQLVGDLHLFQLFAEFRPYISQEQACLLEGFIEALKALDTRVEGPNGFEDPEALLSSKEWARLKEMAAGVVKVFGPTRPC